MVAEGGSLAPGSQVDVAVVGAGVSGTYVCWRLRQAGRNPVLFEMSNRIGGRLLSVTPPDMPHLRGELGGMRFLTSQQFVVSLVNELKLSTAPFPTGGLRNFSELRGVVLRDPELSNPALVPYRLEFGEQGLNPGQLLVEAIKTVVPNATTLTPRDWEGVKQTQQWRGQHLYDWGLWNVLLQVLSSEGYAFLLEGGGYESLADNWNLAEACEYLLSDFPSNVSYLRLVDGFQAFPEKLAHEFEGLGGKIYLDHRLTTFEVRQSGEYPVELALQKGEQTPFKIMAKELVLAMPQRSLNILAEKTPFLGTPPVLKLLDKVMAMPAFKVLLGYPDPWWQRLRLYSGRSTTDLPVRQVYYVGTEADYGPSNRRSLLLAAYADGRAESFWRGLIDRTQFQIHHQSRLQFLANPEPGNVNVPPAPPVLLDTLNTLLAQMHRLACPPQPCWSAYWDWTFDPYGGGWHFWKVGERVWEVIKDVRRPVAGKPVYICGESYTNEQGWVEGALHSAEHVLEDHLGVPRPDWLPKDYYLGP